MPGGRVDSRRERGFLRQGIKMSEIMIIRRTPDIAVVTINRPARRNACNLAAWRDLAGAFTDLAGDRTVRLVILTGAAGHFCAGADISEFSVIRADSTAGRPSRRRGCARCAPVRVLCHPP